MHHLEVEPWYARYFYEDKSAHIMNTLIRVFDGLMSLCDIIYA